MILRIKPRDDTASEDPITDPRVHNAERNRRCPTSQIDKHLSRRSSTCLFAIEIHSEDLEEAVIEHNPRYYSRLWRGTRMLEVGMSGPERVCPHSTFDYQRYRPLGPSRTQLLYWNEHRCERHFRRGGFSANAMLYVAKVRPLQTHKFQAIPKYMNAKVRIIFLQEFINEY